MHLKKALRSHSALLDGLEKNPLPSSFEIVFKDIHTKRVAPKEIKEKIEKLKGVDEVQYSEQWIERFKGLMDIVNLVGFIIGGFLCLAVIFIITNTIKLNIYSRRDEIEIYKLVGATDWFVKAPFLIEGGIQGVIGGLMTLLVLYASYRIFTMKTVQLFGLPIMEITFFPREYMIFLVLLSMGLGLIGGFVAVGRFFRISDAI